MSLPDMLKALKLTEYSDYYMNVAAAVDVYLSIRDYNFDNSMAVVASYYNIDVEIMLAYFNDRCPFTDDTYIKLIEIIKARDKYTSAQDFCIHSSYWIGCENQAEEMLEKMKTLEPPLFRFERPRQIWRERTWRDLWFNIFD